MFSTILEKIRLAIIFKTEFTHVHHSPGPPINGQFVYEPGYRWVGFQINTFVRTFNNCGEEIDYDYEMTETVNLTDIVSEETETRARRSAHNDAQANELILYEFIPLIHHLNMGSDQKFFQLVPGSC